MSEKRIDVRLRGVCSGIRLLNRPRKKNKEILIKGGKGKGVLDDFIIAVGHTLHFVISVGDIVDLFNLVRRNQLEFLIQTGSGFRNRIFLPSGCSLSAPTVFFALPFSQISPNLTPLCKQVAHQAQRPRQNSVPINSACHLN